MNNNKRLKILIVTDFIPYPLSSGGRICLFNFVDYLRKDHDFTLFTPSYSTEIDNEKKALNKLWNNVKLFNVDLSGDRNSEALPSFKFRVLKFFKRKIDRIINEISVEEKNNYKLDFTVPFKPKPKLYIKELKAICDANEFDIIQVQFSGNLNLIEFLPQKPIKIFEQIESQYDVLKDYAESIKTEQIYTDYLSRNSEVLENSYIGKYDAVFTLNAKDTEYFKLELGHSNIFTSPFGVLNKDVLKDVKQGFSPIKIVFSGNESHHPNYDALQWYLKEMHGEITKEHQLSLHVTGVWSEHTQAKFKKMNSQIVFEGFVDDYQSFLKNSIVIVPIRIGGGGLRTKILYAMANGSPVVTTSIGSFGIEGVNEEHYFVSDTELDFVNSIGKLITNLEKTDVMVENAHTLVMNKYNQTKTSEVRNSQYLELVPNE